MPAVKLGDILILLFISRLHLPSKGSQGVFITFPDTYFVSRGTEMEPVPEKDEPAPPLCRSFGQKAVTASVSL